MHESSLSVQAERWGSELITEDVEFLDLQQRPFTVRSSEVEVSLLALYLLRIMLKLLHAFVDLTTAISYSIARPMTARHWVLEVWY